MAQPFSIAFPYQVSIPSHSERLAETKRFIEDKIGLQTRYADYESLDVIVPPNQTASVMDEIRHVMSQYNSIASLENDGVVLLKLMPQRGHVARVATNLPSRIVYKVVDINKPSKWYTTLKAISDSLLVLGLHPSDLTDDLYITREDIGFAWSNAALNQARINNSNLYYVVQGRRGLYLSPDSVGTGKTPIR